MHTTVRRAVIIGNGFAGAENQCYGLIRALGLFHRHSLYRVRRPKEGINKWLNWLPVATHKRLDRLKRQLFHPRYSVSGYRQKAVSRIDQSNIIEADAELIATNAIERFEKDGPLLVVASGQDTISVAASVKRLAPDHVFTVQIQHPRSHLNRFDLVISPRHDYYPQTLEGKKQIPWFLRGWITPRQPPGRNVVLTLGALHQVDSAALQSAASIWHEELASFSRPMLVVNIGGPIHPNPHIGHLALADAFVITADSVSMLSEACSTGKPVYVIGAERCTWKFAYFQKCLQERGMVRPFTGGENITEKWTYAPLQDTMEAAEHVARALSERGWILDP